MPRLLSGTQANSQDFPALKGCRKYAKTAGVSHEALPTAKYNGIAPLGGSPLRGLLEIAFVLLSCYLTFVKMSRRP